jgi:4a-hydroxytetrahydrobiopterin dehydratase
MTPEHDLKPLSVMDLEAALKSLPNWSYKPDQAAIDRHFVFKDFSQALDFMTQIAIKIDAMDHHPDWRNIYNRVEVQLSTHDVKGVTRLDIDLAQAMDDLFSKNEN